MGLFSVLLKKLKDMLESKPPHLPPPPKKKTETKTTTERKTVIQLCFKLLRTDDLDGNGFKIGPIQLQVLFPSRLPLRTYYSLFSLLKNQLVFFVLVFLEHLVYKKGS